MLNYFTVEQLSKLLGSGIKKKGALSDKIIQRIDNCVRLAITISPHDQKLILES